MTTENLSPEKLEPTIGALAEPVQAALVEDTHAVDEPSTAPSPTQSGLSPVKIIMIMAGLVLLFGLMKFGTSFIDTSVMAQHSKAQSKIVVADLGDMFSQWTKESVDKSDLGVAAQELGQLYYDMGYLVIDSAMTMRIPAEFKMDIPSAAVLLRTKQIRNEYLNEGKVPPEPQKLIEMAQAMTGQ